MKHLAESVIDTVRDSLLVLDEQLLVVTANRRFYDTFDVALGETEGRSLFELGNGQWDIPELRGLLEKSSNSAKPSRIMKWRIDFPTSVSRKCC